jgi:hypothetical protein
VARKTRIVVGERRHFTVLFADVRFGATVHQYTGDGVMAVFGAPVAHQDHAVRACQIARRRPRSFRRSATSAKPGAG